MFNLIADQNQEFSVGPSNLYRFQEWAFNPANFYQIDSFIGQPDPVDFVLQTQIKNYIAALGTDTYIEYYVQTSLRYYPVGSPQWASLSGVIPDATGDGYLLTEFNLNVVTTLAFQNLSQLSEGDYVVEIEHTVKGKTPAGNFDVIEVVDYVLHLNRIIYSGIAIQPIFKRFHHVIGNTLPSETLTVTVNGSFTIEAPLYITLTGGNISLISTTNGIKTYSGVDTQNITATVEIAIELLGELTSPPYTGYINVTNTSGNTDNTLIYIYQYLTAEYTVTPSVLSFTAIQGILEAPAQTISVEGYGSYSATGNSWLTITNATGDNSAVLNVQPISSSNFSPGTYAGEIVIATTEGNFTVYVEYKVVGEIDLGINTSGINFTRDRNTISNFYGADTNTLHIDLSTLVFNYNLLVVSEFVNRFKKGIFNNTTNFFLGSIIEKTMKSLVSLSDIGLDWLPDISGGISATSGLIGGTVYKYYNPSVTRLDYRFKLRATGDTVSEDHFSNIKFIKGRRPKRITSQYGIIDYKESPIRVTKNSITLLNMYRSSGLNKIEILKNSVVVNTFLPENGNNEIFAMRLDFSNTTPGDIIEAKYYNSPNNNIKFNIQKYIVFPEGDYSYHIGWENEHGLLELYEFTGTYKFSNKRDEVIAKTFPNFLEQLNKYEGNKELNFIANTGWILKANQERIDSLLDSSRAWIIFKENRAPISLVPRTKKQINVDSEQGNYEYQIEFTINPQHEFENNTF